MGERWQQMARAYGAGQGTDWASRIASGNAYFQEQQRLAQEAAQKQLAEQRLLEDAAIGQNAYLTGQMLPSQAQAMYPIVEQQAAPAMQSYEALQQAFGPTPTPEQQQVLGNVRQFAGTQPGATVANLQELGGVASLPLESPQTRYGYLQAVNAGLLSEQAARQKALADADEAERRKLEKLDERAWREQQAELNRQAQLQSAQTLAGQAKPLDAKAQQQYKAIIKTSNFLDQLEKDIRSQIPADWNPNIQGAGESLQKELTGGGRFNRLNTDLKTFLFEYKRAVYGEAEPPPAVLEQIRRDLIPGLTTDSRQAMLDKLASARQQLVLERNALEQSTRAGGMALPGAGLSKSTESGLRSVLKNGTPAQKAIALQILQNAGVMVNE